MLQQTAQGFCWTILDLSLVVFRNLINQFNPIFALLNVLIMVVNSRGQSRFITVGIISLSDIKIEPWACLYYSLHMFNCFNEWNTKY